MYKQFSHSYRVTLQFWIFLSQSISCLIGQDTWTHTFGGIDHDMAQSVIETSDGSYLTACKTLSYGSGDYDIWLVKTDLYGDTLWTKTYGGTDGEYFPHIIETSDQSFLIAGFSFSYGSGSHNDSDIWLIKTDVNGDTLWTKTYGGYSWEYAAHISVIETSDESYLIAGLTGSFGSGLEDAWLIKTNMNGDTLWTKTYGGSLYEGANSIIETSDQSYLFVGQTGSIDSANFNAWLVKTDHNGDTLWTKTFGELDWSRAYSVIETSDHSYLIAGKFYSYDSGSADSWLIKTDYDGNTLWTRTYGGSSYDIFETVIETSDQTFLITGSTESFGSGERDIWLIKTDLDGEPLWSQFYGGAQSDEGKSVIETSDQNYLIVGHTKSYGSGASDAWIIKTDSFGNTTLPVSIQNEMVQLQSNSLLIAPNPMNNKCSFTYTLHERSNISIDIYNINGTRVWSRDLDEQQGGTYRNVWNAQDQNGANLGSGIYVLQISTSSWKESRKLILLK
jgi:hypothetical protein